MHILQVHNFYQQTGGEDIVLANEEKLLNRRGHQVWQYSLHNEVIPSMPGWQVATDSLWNADAYRAVRRRIQQHGIGVVHVHNTFPLISPSVYYAAQAEHVPVVQTLHNFRLLCPAATFFRDGGPCEDCLEKKVKWPGVVNRCYRGSLAASGMTALMLAGHRAAGTYASKVDAYVTFSKFLLEKFVKGGLPRGKMHIKPNFVLDDPGIGSGYGGYALFVGRLAPEKGLATLLKAWAALSLPITLKIAGDGPMREDVESLAQTLPNVEYLGYCSRTRVTELMRSAALLVFPSEWYEGSPMSMIEAMACGTPVLTSDCGTLAEMIDPGKNGLAFQAGDVHALAQGLERAFAPGDYLSGMRYSARQYYETHFAAGPNYDALMAIYEHAAGRAV